MYLQQFLATTPLELIAGFGYLIGHFLLSKKNLWGWVVKIVGAICWIIFLFKNGNYIFMAVTIAVVVTMFYGLYKWQVGQASKETKVDHLLQLLTVSVATFMIGRFVYVGNYEPAPIFETFIVIAEITGTFLLARRNILGWYFLIFMSTLVGILVIFINSNPAPILGILELASIYFYIKGIRLHKTVAI